MASVLSFDGVSSSGASISTVASDKVLRQQEKDAREKADFLLNSRILLAFTETVRRHYWNSWGRTYLNDKVRAEVVRDASSPVGCLPVVWADFFHWIASRRAVSADINQGIVMLNRFHTVATGSHLTPLSGSKDDVFRAIRKQPDNEFKKELNKFVKIIYKK